MQVLGHCSGVVATSLRACRGVGAVAVPAWPRLFSAPSSTSAAAASVAPLPSNVRLVNVEVVQNFFKPAVTLGTCGALRCRLQATVSAF